MMVENMLLYIFGCQNRDMFFFAYTRLVRQITKNIRKSLGETRKVVTEGENLKIVSEYVIISLPLSIKTSFQEFGAAVGVDFMSIRSPDRAIVCERMLVLAATMT